MLSRVVYWLFAERHHPVDDAGAEDQAAAEPRAHADEAHEERWDREPGEEQTNKIHYLLSEAGFKVLISLSWGSR